MKKCHSREIVNFNKLAPTGTRVLDLLNEVEMIIDIYYAETPFQLRGMDSEEYTVLEAGLTPQDLKKVYVVTWKGAEGHQLSHIPYPVFRNLPKGRKEYLEEQYVQHYGSTPQSPVPFYPAATESRQAPQNTYLSVRYLQAQRRKTLNLKRIT